MAEVGHNSSGNVKSIVERIERLTDERSVISLDIREVYKEAKSNGFDTKALRRVIRERAKDQNKRREENALFEAYAAALGLLD